MFRSFHSKFLNSSDNQDKESYFSFGGLQPVSQPEARYCEKVETIQGVGKSSLRPQRGDGGCPRQGLYTIPYVHGDMCFLAIRPIKVYPCCICNPSSLKEEENSPLPREEVDLQVSVIYTILPPLSFPLRFRIDEICIRPNHHVQVQFCHAVHTCLSSWHHTRKERAKKEREARCCKQYIHKRSTV